MCLYEAKRHLGEASNHINLGIGSLLEPRKKNTLIITFHYTGWLIGILILAYYNPYLTGQYKPLYTLNNQGFFHGSLEYDRSHMFGYV